MSKENNLKDYLKDLYAGIASKKPNASKNPQKFRSEIESIVTESEVNLVEKTITANDEYLPSDDGADGYSKVKVNVQPKLQAKEHLFEQNGVGLKITPDEGYDGLSEVAVSVLITETPDNPLPIEVSTEAEMTALLESAEVGSVYKYVGETTDTYESGALYVVEVSE